MRHLQNPGDPRAKHHPGRWILSWLAMAILVAVSFASTRQSSPASTDPGLELAPSPISLTVESVDLCQLGTR
ncbi:MAG: hypothetical protein JNK85_08605 [Verrucomicrobiales bacterium]|nr:hypothetical protein [Verrucomicrobiales bacterium]